MATEPVLWCPSCGGEFRADTAQCPDCRVALTPDEPVFVEADDSGLVELGEWPRVQALVLRRRLESASVPVMIEWSGTTSTATGVILVPDDQSEFGSAVVNEIDVEEEIDDQAPQATVIRIEEHLSAAADLLAELRARLDDLEADD